MGHKHHKHSGKHHHRASKDNAGYYKRRALSSIEFRKKASKVLFTLLTIVAILVVIACIYVYSF